jgi:hypothetical protein
MVGPCIGGIKMLSSADCPHCRVRTKVLKQVHIDDAVRRRRVCPDCNYRCTTYERVGVDVPENGKSKSTNGPAPSLAGATTGFGTLGAAQPVAEPTAPRWTAAVQKQVQEYIDLMLPDWIAGRLQTEGGTTLNPPPPNIEEMSLEDQYDAFVAARDA